MKQGGERVEVPRMRTACSSAGMSCATWIARETFAKGLEDPISCLNINLMSYRQLAVAPDDVRL